MANPWDKLPDEGPAAWEAFCLYRDSGNRSIADIAQQLRKTKPVLCKWSRTYRWVERRSAWAAAQDKALTTRRLQVIADAEEERMEQVRQMHVRHASFAMTLQKKIKDKLDKLDIESMEPRDIARWLEVAVKIERLARGVPANEVAITGPAGGPIEHSVSIEDAAERVTRAIGGILAIEEADGLVDKPH